jgi:vacuolar-type H+-ATPase subunit E/Vma4
MQKDPKMYDYIVQ